MATVYSRKRKKLQKIATHSQKEGAIFKIRGVFPFDFLPNSLILEKNKVDIVYYRFPFYKKVFSIFYKDIRTVKIEEGIFFATIHFEIKAYEQNPEPIGWLFKWQAHKARNMILGICAAKIKEVPVPKEIETKSKKALNKLGKVKYK